ncbi:hypothetical protein BH23ACT10_BH23ACT10_31900 [soil metagenome]
MSYEGSGRTLKTARAVLQVLKMMAKAPDGVRPEELARTLHKSTSTATYLLNSLCREGFAERDAGDGQYRLVEPMASRQRPYALPAEDLDVAVQELYARTNERAYLAVAEDSKVVVHESRGRQGLPKVPGLKPHIGGEAHALAVGKTVLAHLGPDSVGEYHDAYGLQAYTASTITDPDQLESELAEVRHQGFAVDREEFAEGFCCVAAPIFDHAGELCGSLALSTTRARFNETYRRLIPIVMAVARAAGHHGRAPSWEHLSSPRVPDRPPLRAVN